MTFAERHMNEVSGKWASALQSYIANAGLREAVETLTDSFFTRNAGIERTALAERFITALALSVVLNLPASPSPEANQTRQTEAA